MTNGLPRLPRREMTPDERSMARAISPNFVDYIPGIPTKRFARNLSELADMESAPISEGQAKYLRDVVWRFRRQLPRAIVALVEPTEAIR